MLQIIKSPQAQEDAEQIWHYIAQDNPTAADQLLRTFDAQMQRLAEMPGLGRHRDELAADLHGLPVGSYILFYRKIPDGIEVVRILHGARNLRRIFKKP